MKNIFFIIILLFSSSTFSNADENNYLFSINIDKDLKEYKNYLEKPALLILILKNIEIQQFKKINPKIKDLQNVSFTLSGNLNRYIEIPINLKFLNKKNDIYEYKISSSSKLLSIDTKMSIDLSKIDKEIIYINLEEMPKNYITNGIIEKVNEKIKFLINELTQKKILDYFKQTAIDPNSDEKIFIDYINLEKSNELNQNNIKPQKFLILNFIIFLLNIFVLSLIVRLFLKK